MSKRESKDKTVRYEVITQYDEASDDLLIPLPPPLLEKMGWTENDQIEITVDEFGRYVLKKTGA